ncbi:hypothetical protein ACJX0J_019369 [Zea mays]
MLIPYYFFFLDRIKYRFFFLKAYLRKLIISFNPWSWLQNVLSGKKYQLFSLMKQYVLRTGIQWICEEVAKSQISRKTNFEFMQIENCNPIFHMVHYSTVQA